MPYDCREHELSKNVGFAQFPKISYFSTFPSSASNSPFSLERSIRSLHVNGPHRFVSGPASFGRPHSVMSGFLNVKSTKPSTGEIEVASTEIKKSSFFKEHGLCTVVYFRNSPELCSSSLSKSDKHQILRAN